MFWYKSQNKVGERNRHKKEPMLDSMSVHVYYLRSEVPWKKVYQRKLGWRM